MRDSSGDIHSVLLLLDARGQPHRFSGAKRGYSRHHLLSYYDMAHLQPSLAFHAVASCAWLWPPAPLAVHRLPFTTGGLRRHVPLLPRGAWASPRLAAAARPSPRLGSTAAAGTAADKDVRALPHFRRALPVALAGGSPTGGIGDGGDGGDDVVAPALAPAPAPTPPLPPSVGVVIDAETGRGVLVVGVMHGMPASVADVAAVVGGGAGGWAAPAAVVLELCGSRYAALCGREARHSAPVALGGDGEDGTDGAGGGGEGARGVGARPRLELQPPLPPLPASAAVATAATTNATQAAAAAADGDAAPAVAGGDPAVVPPPPPPLAAPKASPSARFGRAVVRFGGVGAAIFAIGLSSLTGVQQAAGMDPGCEFKEAARRAKEVGAPVVLGDNDVRWRVNVAAAGRAHCGQQCPCSVSGTGGGLECSMVVSGGMNERSAAVWPAVTGFG